VLIIFVWINCYRDYLGTSQSQRNANFVPRVVNFSERFSGFCAFCSPNFISLRLLSNLSVVKVGDYGN
jgi:hypothetical protein